MLFQSYIFILLFLPLCLLGFWGLKRQKLLQLWLIAFSLWFYGAASPYYLLLLLGSIAWNYAFFRAIERGIGRVTERVSGSAMERAEYGMERDSSRKRLLLGIGIAGNLALLCFFKYFNGWLESDERAGGSDSAACIAPWHQLFYLSADWISGRCL